MRSPAALAAFLLAGCAATHASDVDAAVEPDASARDVDSAVEPDASSRDTGPAPSDDASVCSWGGGCALDGHDCPPGQGCVPGPTATVCAPVGSAPPGAACTATSDCQAGAICVTHTGGARTCRSLACDWRACVGMSPVGPTFYAVPAPIPLGVCDDEWCTPFPDSCPEGFACHLGIDSWVVCTTIGTAAEGEACARADDCQVGLTCSGPVCVRMCQSDADCTGHCSVGGVGVGVCGP